MVQGGKIIGINQSADRANKTLGKETTQMPPKSVRVY